MEAAADGPINLKTPVRFADPLPDEVDVVVIGGGIIGISSALYLADEGFSVALVEKGRMGCEQSSRNWGWVRQQGRDLDELPIAMEANRLWDDLDKKTKGETRFTRGGVMFLTSTEAKLSEREKWLEIAKLHQLDTRVIDTKQIAELIDQGGDKSAHKWVGATYTPSDGRAEPWVAVPALTKLAQDKGVSIIENCAVRGLDRAGGVLKGVITEQGTISCDQIVVAAGAWTSLLLQRHGISIPQLSVRSSVCRTGPLPEVFTGNAFDETMSFRRRADGCYTVTAAAAHELFIGRDAFRHFPKWLKVAAAHIGDTSFKPAAPEGFPDAWGTPRKWAEDEQSPFEKTRVLEPAPNTSRVEELREAFAKRFPQLGKPDITHKWAGMIDAMPDAVPIVDHVPDADGIIVATGMSGHGFGIGPAFGKIVAKLAARKPTGHNLNRFRFNRFTDGSKIVPGPAI